MSTQVLTNSDTYSSDKRIKTNVSGNVLSSAHRHVRDPKLLPKEDMTNDNEMHLLKKVWNQALGDFTNYIEFHIRTNHTAQTSTLTVEWGDGTANSTYTPDSQGNVTFSKNYSYSSSGLSTYDSDLEIKQALIKVYPTNDDFDFTHVYNYNIDDSARNDHTVNSSYTEIRWKSQACTTFRFQGTDNTSDDYPSDGSVANSPNQNPELEYVEIIKMHDNPTGNAYISEESFGLNTKSIIVHDFKGCSFGAAWKENTALEEVIVLKDSTTNASASDAVISERGFYNCYSLKLLHIDLSQSARMLQISRFAFQRAASLKYLFLGGLKHSTQNYNHMAECYSLEELYVQFHSDSGNTSNGDPIEGWGYRNRQLKYVNNPNKLPGGNKLDFSTMTSGSSLDEIKYNMYECTSIEDIHIVMPNINWTSSNKIDMNNTFRDSKHLKKFILENPNSNEMKIDNLAYFAFGAHSLEDMEFRGNWTFTNEFDNANFTNTFRECHTLEYDMLPSWLQTIELKSASYYCQFNYMFDKCTRLYKGIKIKFPDNGNGTTTGNIKIDHFNNIYQRSMIRELTSENWDFNNYKQTGSSKFNWSLPYMYNLVEFSGFEFQRFNINNWYFNYAFACEKITGNTYPAAADMFNISIRNIGCDGDELDAFFGELPDLTGETSKTITITDALGAADCDTTILTDKNYTVTN